MPLQNRVDPLGAIRSLDFRGQFMGNRGVLHDDSGRIVRYQATRAWIICALSFMGRHRELLQPGRWTELFFWDEATALAAGHRPCFECRRPDATTFLALFRTVTGRPEAMAPDVDRQLSTDRRRSGRSQRVGSGRILVMGRVDRLPQGALVLHDGEPHVVVAEGLRPWTPAGYGPVRAAPDDEVPIITPLTTIRIITAGYAPTIRLTP